MNSPTLSTSDTALRALVDAVDLYLGARPSIEQQRAWALLEECLTSAKARLEALDGSNAGELVESQRPAAVQLTSQLGSALI